MPDPVSRFSYFSRRARQEALAAINAATPAAEAAHRRLSNLHAAQALLAMIAAEDWPKASRKLAMVGSSTA